MLYNKNTVLDIRQIVEFQISQYLGVFTTGATALWVQPPMAPDFDKGVQCLINRDAKKIGISGQFEWQISLVVVLENNQNIDDIYLLNYSKCLDRLRKRFPVSREIHKTYRGFYPQCDLFLIYNSEAYK